MMIWLKMNHATDSHASTLIQWVKAVNEQLSTCESTHVSFLALQVNDYCHRKMRSLLCESLTRSWNSVNQVLSSKIFNDDSIEVFAFTQFNFNVRIFFFKSLYLFFHCKLDNAMWWKSLIDFVSSQEKVAVETET